MSAQSNSEEKKLFKDWFDKAAAEMLADQVTRGIPKFDRKRFIRLATKQLNTLEMSGRVQQFSDALRTTLPDDVPKALSILTKSLPEAQLDCDSVTDGWLQWPLGQFIADHGTDHFDASMEAMIELTQRFSSEFAVRPFVEKYPEAIFKKLLKLTQHSNPHVRRWCSEGVRPRLPWGKVLRDLVDDPSPIFPILEALKDDDELYVRRSVANNLNDIAKDNPKQVIQRCKAWSKKSNANRDWVIKHALRSLIKDGNKEALAIIGYGPPKQLSATLEIKPKKISIGQSVEMTATLSTTASRAQDLVIDYVVHYIRQGGKTSGKVFKWTTTALSAKGSLPLKKNHAMKKTTVRALYPGTHRVELQANGERIAEAQFHLK